jgi:hypothetical protein
MFVCWTRICPKQDGGLAWPGARSTNRTLLCAISSILHVDRATLRPSKNDVHVTLPALKRVMIRRHVPGALKRSFPRMNAGAPTVFTLADAFASFY